MRKYFLSLIILFTAGGCVTYKENEAGIADTYNNLIDGVELYGLDDSIEGKRLKKWIGDWWVWAHATDAPGDTTGENCAAGQNDKVWFLAGSYERKKITRNCVVPQGKPIIFPIINYISFAANEDSIDCLCYADHKGSQYTRFENLFLIINGISYYSNYLSWSYIEGNRCNVECDKSMHSNGIYVALRPLPPGEYKIEFGGLEPYSRFSQDIVYTIRVE